ncbi:uncharacterized protein LOC118456448 isoform X1 [Anopheles albimanus]|uniref:uncharacterized protein LOC118456448 isoform X1 n=1 Tax=Anopheles albimanus TaxID=7167 RepID=UPI001641D60C|nr:uncharacterized protein LOC118456448 isoform X1 [Anopheles albimanus]
MNSLGDSRNIPKSTLSMQSLTDSQVGSVKPADEIKLAVTDNPSKTLEPNNGVENLIKRKQMEAVEVIEKLEHNNNKIMSLENDNPTERFNAGLGIQHRRHNSAEAPVPLVMSAETSEKQKSEQEKPSSQQKNKPSSHHGSNYQVKITMWTLLYAQRDLSEGKYSKCSITPEDPNGGKFDDTVLHYTQPNDGEKVLYLQAKHRYFNDIIEMNTKLCLKNKDFVGKKADSYSVAKYYKSFYELYPKGRIAGAKFVVCTNGYASNSIQLLQKLEPADEIFENFKRIGASFYRIDKEKLFNDNKFKCDLCELDVPCEETKFGIFCDQFFLITNVADGAIDKDMQELWRFIAITNRPVLSVQMGLIEQTTALNSLFIAAWNMTRSSQTKTHFEIEDLFQKIVRNLYYLQLKGSASIYCNSLFKLNDDHLKKSKLYKICEEGGTHKYHTILSTEMSYSIIQQIARLLASGYIFIDGKNNLKSAENVLQDLFCFLECDLVLVVREKDYSFTNLQELTKNNATGFRRSIITIVEGSKQNESEVFSVSHLTNDSKKEIVMNYSQIRFVHTNIRLENFITEDDDLALLYELVTAADEEKHKTHPCVKDIEKIQTLYINRIWKTIERENYLSPQRLYYRAKYIPLSLAQMKLPMTFYEVAEELEYPSRYIHRRKSFDRRKSTPKKPPNSGKVHIFLDEAGYGKTTYMTWLTSYFVDNHPSWWIIRLNAIEYSYDFDQIMKDHGTSLNENEAVRILFQLIYLALFKCMRNTKSNEETDSERKQMKRWAECLTFSQGMVVLNCTRDVSIEQQIVLRVFREKFNQKQIVLILDGFDEIAPDYKDVVLTVFSRFATFDGIHKMYLTSRPYNFVAFQVTNLHRLDPFTEWDQYDLMGSYLTYNLSEYDSSEDIQRKYLLEIFLEIIEIYAHGLHSIPLFFRMALDILMPSFRKHTDLKNYTISPGLFKELGTVFSKSRMLEAFVSQKLSIANNEKAGANKSTRYTAQSKHKAKKWNEWTRQMLALLGIYTIYGISYYLLSEEDLAKCKEYIKEIKEGLEKSGIIEGVQGNVPIFIHRMFAEYFAACWLFDNRDRQKVMLFFKMESSCEHKNRIVRNLFDEIATQNEYGMHSQAHLAVIRDERDNFMRAIENENNLHESTDRLGRTPLHLAVQYNISTEIAEVLVEKMGDSKEQFINAKDNLLGWSALDYAFFINHFQMIQYILSKNASIHTQVLLNRLLDLEVMVAFQTLSRYDKYVMDSTRDIDKYKPLHDNSEKQINDMSMVCDRIVNHFKMNNDGFCITASKSYVI